MFTDLPIHERKNDTYNRIKFCETIGDIFISAKKGDTICVGLMGSWGSGKTSIINMTQEYIESEERTPRIKVIRFEPWNFTTSEQLVNQFFVQLADYFGVDNSEKGTIGKVIHEYASKMDHSTIGSLLFKSSVLGSALSALISLVAEKTGEAIENQDFTKINVQEQKDKLYELLQDSKEKLVIVIDDIDRLTDDQIRSVFQLVSIVCKFPNINYLLSFDRDVVARALDKIQEGKGSEFIDKVIQVPVTIPIIPKRMLLSLLKTRLEETLGDDVLQTIDKKKWELLSAYCVVHLIKTPRDILRLCNGIKSKTVMISEEIDCTDLIALTIIEQHEPRLFYWVKRNKDLLIAGETEEFSYDFRHEDEIHLSEKRKRLDEEIRGLLCHTDDYTSYLALQTLIILFPRFSSLIEESKLNNDREEDLLRKNCIAHPLKFDRYFSYSIGNDQITKSYLQYILEQASEQEIVDTIVEKNKVGAAEELLLELDVHKGSLDEERIETIIKALVVVGDQYVSYSNDGYFTTQVLDVAVNLIYRLWLMLDKTIRYGYLETYIIPDTCEANLDLISGLLDLIAIKHEEEEKQYAGEPNGGIYPGYRFGEINTKYLYCVNSILNNTPIVSLMQKENFIQYCSGNGKEWMKSISINILNDYKATAYYLSIMMEEYSISGQNAIHFPNYDPMFMDVDSTQSTIQKVINNKQLNTLSDKEQHALIAFMLLYRKENKSYFVPISDVDKEIRKII